MADNQQDPCQTCGAAVRLVEASVDGALTRVRACTCASCPTNNGDASLADIV